MKKEPDIELTPAESLVVWTIVAAGLFGVCGYAAAWIFYGKW